MLTDIQVKELAGKLSIPLEAVCFKSTLKDMKLKYNRSYIINLENYTINKIDTGFGVGWVTVSVIGNNMYFDVTENTSQISRSVTIEVTNTDTLQVASIFISQFIKSSKFDSTYYTFDSTILTFDNN